MTEVFSRASSECLRVVRRSYHDTGSLGNTLCCDGLHVGRMGPKARRCTVITCCETIVYGRLGGSRSTVCCLLISTLYSIHATIVSRNSV